jgi:hypothetical protein
VTIDLTPVADSTVKSNQGSANLGASEELHVDPNPSATERSLLRFDLSTIPSGSAVFEATLTLCPVVINSTAVGRMHHVHRVVETWTELGVSWTNQPLVLEPPTDQTAVLAGLFCISFDVIDDAQAWVDGTLNFGFQVGDANENTSGAGMRYASRENIDSSRHPQLSITYEVP